MIERVNSPSCGVLLPSSLWWSFTLVAVCATLGCTPGSTETKNNVEMSNIDEARQSQHVPQTQQGTIDEDKGALITSEHLRHLDPGGLWGEGANIVRDQFNTAAEAFTASQELCSTTPIQHAFEQKLISISNCYERQLLTGAQQLAEGHMVIRWLRKDDALVDLQLIESTVSTPKIWSCVQRQLGHIRIGSEDTSCTSGETTIRFRLIEKLPSSPAENSLGHHDEKPEPPIGRGP